MAAYSFRGDLSCATEEDGRRNVPLHEVDEAGEVGVDDVVGGARAVSTIRLALVPNTAPDEDMVLMPRRGISVVAIITRGPMSTSSSSGVGAVALELCCCC